VSTARPAADRQGGSPPPRERILAAARELFYRRGIHAVGVDAIAAAAGTNKMTLYRHSAPVIAGPSRSAGISIKRRPAARTVATVRYKVATE
jgi:hypothetical protein